MNLIPGVMFSNANGSIKEVFVCVCIYIFFFPHNTVYKSADVIYYPIIKHEHYYYTLPGLYIWIIFIQCWNENTKHIYHLRNEVLKCFVFTSLITATGFRNLIISVKISQGIYTKVIIGKKIKALKYILWKINDGTVASFFSGSVQTVDICCYNLSEIVIETSCKWKMKLPK